MGNGRLGAMIFGATGRERIQLNEETLWSGGPQDTVNVEAVSEIGNVRRLLFTGKPREALELADQTMMSRPRRLLPYQSLGDLSLVFEGHETAADYRLFALADALPKKPGLLRVPEGTGAAIEVEVWALPVEGFGAFVATVPPPLSIGTLRLSDGRSVKGFLAEAEGVAGAQDISKFGGWRAYIEARER